MAYLKPQGPLRQGTDYVYPVTTYDQIITPTGGRWNGTTMIVSDKEPLDTNIWVDTSENSIEIMPKNAIKYLEFTIAASDWTNSDSIYTYTVSKGAITDSMCVITMSIDADSQSNLNAAIDWETANGSITFSTSTIPNGVVKGYCVMVEVEVL